MADESHSVTLPGSLIERIETRVAGTEFDSVDAYVEYVLNEVLTHLETETATKSHSAISESDIRDRLQALGYLEE